MNAFTTFVTTHVLALGILLVAVLAANAYLLFTAKENQRPRVFSDDIENETSFGNSKPRKHKQLTPSTYMLATTTLCLLILVAIFLIQRKH